jgi:serine/threonine-protein kinase
MRRLSPGTSVSHYRIIEEIGAGGMGVVYKAEDTKLRRHVALKFLPPYLTQDADAKQRFVHEAQAASALDHNNICAIHEIDETHDGRMFISMACYEGETLRDRIERGPLGLDEVLDTAMQISEGLGKAHGKGIVHRDIKPANIMITEDGIVKIMDFGLAKLAGQTRITRTGTTMGTVAYMSPEQAQGGEVDERSDIFSLGVIMYEMVTGRRPFKGDYEAAALYSIVHDEPEPISRYRPEVLDEMEMIVERALRKEADSRYQSSSELLADLKRLKQGTLTGVAVKRRGAFRRKGPMLVGFAAVITLAILALLSRYLPSDRGGSFLRRLVNWGKAGDLVLEMREERFVVVVAPFWGTTEKAVEEGKVMQALIDRQLRTELAGEPAVTILSEDVSDVPRSREDAEALGGAVDATVVIWGEVLALHEEVEIQPYLTYLKRDADPSEPALAGLSANLAERSQLKLRKAQAEEIGDVALVAAARYYAWRAPDKAIAILRKISTPTSESLQVEATIAYIEMRHEEAERLLLEAVSLDPSNPLAIRGLASLYGGQGRHDEAVALVERSLSADPQNGQLRFALAEAYGRKGDRQKAISLLQDLVVGDPGNSELHVQLGWAYARGGRLDEAIEEHKMAIRTDPENVSAYQGLAWAYEFRDSLDLAVSKYKEAARLNKGDGSYFIHSGLGRSYLKQSMYREAVPEFQKTIVLAPTMSGGYSLLGQALVGLGEEDEIEDAIEWVRSRLAHHSDDARVRYRLGRLYYALGREGEAIAEYQEAIRLDPDCGDVRYSLGWVYEFQDSLDRAAINYEQAISLGTTEIPSWMSHSMLGRVYLKQDNHLEATSEIEKAIALLPTNAHLYSDLVKAYLGQTDYEKAIEAARQAIALDPVHNYHRFYLGAALMFQGKYEEVIAELRQSVEADSGDVYGHLFYFIALNKGDRSEEAQKHLAHLAEMRSDDSWETALVRFYTGGLDEDALLKLIESQDPEESQRRECEAHYYLAMAYLLDAGGGLTIDRPDTARAQVHFEQCLATGLKTFGEYILAKHELALLQKGETQE